MGAKKVNYTKGTQKRRDASGKFAGSGTQHGAKKVNYTKGTQQHKAK